MRPANGSAAPGGVCNRPGRPGEQHFCLDNETISELSSYLHLTEAPSLLCKWRFDMKRLMLAAVAAAAFSAPALAADCAKDYKAFWDNLDRSRFAKMSAEQIADLSRTALRGYDACTAGDERFTAENFFKKLDRTGPNAKASDIFKSGAFDPPGAKK